MTLPIFIAGHRGLVGSALVRACAARGLATITRTRDELNLRDAAAVHAMPASRSTPAVNNMTTQTVLVAGACPS